MNHRLLFSIILTVAMGTQLSAMKTIDEGKKEVEKILEIIALGDGKIADKLLLEMGFKSENIGKAKEQAKVERVVDIVIEAPTVTEDEMLSKMGFKEENIIKARNIIFKKIGKIVEIIMEAPTVKNKDLLDMGFKQKNIDRARKLISVRQKKV